jgi:hypothetical protein
MEDGRVIEPGARAALMAKRGVYHAMVSRQIFVRDSPSTIKLNLTETRYLRWRN